MKLKKIVSLFLAVILLSVMIAGCTNGPQDPTGSGSKLPGSSGNSDPLTGDHIIGDIPVEFPLVEEPAVLKIMSSVSFGDFNDMVMWNAYEKMTGVDVAWTQVSASGRAEKYAAALAGGDDYDLIYKMSIGTTTLNQYGEQGLIYDLSQLLEEYAPNCWRYLQNHPEILAGITAPTGEIWGLPQVCSGAETRVGRKIWINKRWLENVGMEVPSTTEELYQVLKAFKEKDANGNGDANDEIPLCNQSYQAWQDMLYGAFGIGNRGQNNDLVDWDYEKDSTRLIPTTDGYKQMLQYMNRLYTEGLVDKEIFTMSTANWTIKAADDRIGCFCLTNLATLPYSDHSDWVGIETALEGPGGDSFWFAVKSEVHTTGNAVIPVTCENPGLVLQWLDYFWTDEGALFYCCGVEGESYVKNADGSYGWSESVLSLMSDGASYDDAVSTVTPYPGGGNATVLTAPYYLGGEMTQLPAQTARALFAYAPEEIWPNIVFSSEEGDELSSLRTDINKYIKSSRTEFITGTKSFDEWDSYVAAIEHMGADRVLEIYKDAVDRYHQLIGK